DLVAQVQAVVAQRTVPHRDDDEVGRAAWRLLHTVADRPELGAAAWEPVQGPGCTGSQRRPGGDGQDQDLRLWAAGFEDGRRVLRLQPFWGLPGVPLPQAGPCVVATGLREEAARAARRAAAA